MPRVIELIVSKDGKRRSRPKASLAAIAFTPASGWNSRLEMSPATRRPSSSSRPPRPSSMSGSSRRSKRQAREVTSSLPGLLMLTCPKGDP